MVVVVVIVVVLVVVVVVAVATSKRRRIVVPMVAVRRRRRRRPRRRRRRRRRRRCRFETKAGLRLRESRRLWTKTMPAGRRWAKADYGKFDVLHHLSRCHVAMGTKTALEKVEQTNGK